jgi:predicted PurR-regulated permease PerM
VWVIFAVMAGGALIGFTGVILAIPVAATIGCWCASPRIAIAKAAST